MNSTFLKSLNLYQDTQETSDIQGIIEPAPVSFSFDTLGWKIVGVIILMLLIRLLFILFKRYQKNAYKREAIAYLSSFDGHSEPVDFESVSTTLKKVALISYGRESVAALHGLNWLNFLQEKGKDTPFLKYEDALMDVLYSKKKLDKTTSEKLLALSKKWIKTHA